MYDYYVSSWTNLRINQTFFFHLFQGQNSNISTKKWWSAQKEVIWLLLPLEAKLLDIAIPTTTLTIIDIQHPPQQVEVIAVVPYDSSQIIIFPICG